MSSRIIQLTVESRDLSQADKKNTVLTSWATLKMTTIFAQNDDFFHPDPFWVNFADLATTVFFSAWDKSHDPTVNWRILDDM